GSTSNANGGIRAQFTTPVNVAMSLASMEILDALAPEIGEPPVYRKGPVTSSSPAMAGGQITALLQTRASTFGLLSHGPRGKGAAGHLPEGHFLRDPRLEPSVLHQARFPQFRREAHPLRRPVIFTTRAAGRP